MNYLQKKLVSYDFFFLEKIRKIGISKIWKNRQEIEF